MQTNQCLKRLLATPIKISQLALLPKSSTYKVKKKKSVFFVQCLSSCLHVEGCPQLFGSIKNPLAVFSDGRLCGLFEWGPFGRLQYVLGPYPHNPKKYDLLYHLHCFQKQSNKGRARRLVWGIRAQILIQDVFQHYRLQNNFLPQWLTAQRAAVLLSFLLFYI